MLDIHHFWLVFVPTSGASEIPGCSIKAWLHFPSKMATVLHAVYHNQYEFFGSNHRHFSRGTQKEAGMRRAAVFTGYVKSEFDIMIFKCFFLPVHRKPWAYTPIKYIALTLIICQNWHIFLIIIIFLFSDCPFYWPLVCEYCCHSKNYCWFRERTVYAEGECYRSPTQALLPYK